MVAPLKHDTPAQLLPDFPPVFWQELPWRPAVHRGRMPAGRPGHGAFCRTPVIVAASRPMRQAAGMADIYRVKALWSGFGGSPGVTTHYLGETPTAADLTAVRTFYNTLAPHLPSGLTIAVPGSGDIIDEFEAGLTGTWTATAPTAVSGSNAGEAPAPVGAVVQWLTAGIHRGKRVRGRSFLVPLAAQYEGNGTLLATFVTTAQGAGTALITALNPKLRVWCRPLYGEGKPRPIIAVGNSFQVTAAAVPDKVMVLRSRRD